MKIKIISIGKTKEAYLQEGLAAYQKRLKHFVKLEWIELPEIKKIKSLSEKQVMQAEAERMQGQIRPQDQVYLLDEKGKTFTSKSFAGFLNQKLNEGRDLVFIIGGPYGIDPEWAQNTQGKIALSTLTFTHQMVRLFFIEQVYRGFSILRNLPYHHE